MSKTLRDEADKMVDAFVEKADTFQKESRSKEEIPEKKQGKKETKERKIFLLWKKTKRILKEIWEESDTGQRIFLVFIISSVIFIIGLFTIRLPIVVVQEVAKAIPKATTTPTELPPFNEINPTPTPWNLFSEASSEIPEDAGFFKGLWILIQTLKFPIISIGVISLLLTLFLEVNSRADRWLLDFWVVVVTVPILAYQYLIPDRLVKGILIGFVATLHLFSIFQNISQSEDRLNEIDLSSLIVESSILLAIYYSNWTWIQYPTIISISTVWLVLVLSSLREGLRAPIPSVVAVIIGGLLGGFKAPAWAVMLAIILLMIIISALANIGITIKQKNSSNISLFGRSIIVVSPWDILILFFVAYIILAYAFHGNFLVSPFQ